MGKIAHKEICDLCSTSEVILLPDNVMACLKDGHTWKLEPRMASACPKCASSATQKLPGGIYRCESCGWMW